MKLFFLRAISNFLVGNNMESYQVILPSLQHKSLKHWLYLSSWKIVFGFHDMQLLCFLSWHQASALQYGLSSFWPSRKCRWPTAFSSLPCVPFAFVPGNLTSPLWIWLRLLPQFLFLVAPYICIMSSSPKEISVYTRTKGWHSRSCNSASIQLGGWMKEGYACLPVRRNRRKENFYRVKSRTELRWH